jgi:hypothetical protein
MRRSLSRWTNLSSGHAATRAESRLLLYKRASPKAKQLIDRRGGTDSLKADAEELRDIAKGPGSVTDKAKRAGEAMKGSRRQGHRRAAGPAPVRD